LGQRETRQKKGKRKTLTATERVSPTEARKESINLRKKYQIDREKEGVKKKKLRR